MKTLIYDFETSGLNPYHEDITEIGCKCLETGESFTCLVQPLSNRLLSEKNQQITGITNELLKKEGLKPMDAFVQFFEFLLDQFSLDSDIIMVAHNGISFDDIFLKRHHRILQGEGYSNYDVMMNKIKFIDSLSISKLMHPERFSYSMKNMCQLYNIVNESEHRAMGDVDALSKLWVYLMKKVSEKQKDTSSRYLKYLLYN